MMTISSIILVLILQTSIVSEVDQIPAWVDSAAYDYVQAVWREETDRLTSEELKRDFGLSGNYDTFECKFKYPGYVGSIDYLKYGEGAQLIDCVEVYEAYAFSVHFGDSYIARITVAKHSDGNYRYFSQSSYGKLISRSADLFWQLYRHFDTQTRKDLRLIVIPDAENRVLAVENNNIIGIYSYDHVNEVIVKHDTQEYVQKKLTYFAKLMNDPVKHDKYYWKDAVQRGIVR
jgi:hypothetical protein